MKISASKCVGAAAFLIGSVWVWGSLIEPVYGALARGDMTVPELVSGLTVFSLLSCPGLFSMFYGFAVIREANKTNIARSIGFLLSCLVLIVSGSVAGLVSSFIGQDTAFSVSLMIFSFVAMPIYAWSSLIVARREDIPVNGVRDFIGKPNIFILA
ncbi:MAG: hypothetical protein AAB570_03160, partial [Patescibacteria group bacterium]